MAGNPLSSGEFDDKPESLENMAKLCMAAKLVAHLNSFTHDIRSPVQTLIMAASALQMQNDDVEVKESFEQLMNRATDRIERTLAGLQLPDVTERNVEPLALKYIIEECSQLWIVSKTRDKSQLHIQIPEDLPAVMCANGVLRFAVMQLLLNAFEAVSENNGEVTVVAEQQGDTVIVRICDNGQGISADVADRIFDPFFSTRSSFMNLGMGLTISSGLLQQTSGSIELAGESPMGGSCFVIKLPILNE